MTDPRARDATPLDAETLAFLNRPGLARLWTAARTRLERNGLQPNGTIRLQRLTAQEREDLDERWAEVEPRWRRQLL